ncbi:MAG: BrnT family toxin [Methylococcales bacterium]|nr:BrnT family toxin [Methylococcales bacterium]
MKFEWDAEKAIKNRKKHNVTFDEAQTVFNDSLAAIFDDEWHSLGECRELIIGHSNKRQLLIVSFTERDGVIRIISSRLATTQERQNYEQYR